MSEPVETVRSVPVAFEEEAALVRACVEGRPGAWDGFVAKYIRLVYHVVRQTLANRRSRASEADVEDVTEEVYLHLVADDFRVLRNLRPPYNLKAWLAISARRKALDHMKRASLPTVSMDAAGPDGDAAIGDTIPDRKSPPLPDETGKEIEGLMESALLNAKERMMITLFYLKEMSYAEISELIGVPENSIGPTLKRAMDKLVAAGQARREEPTS